MKTTSLSAQLPYPPSVNTYWRMFKNRMILSKAGRQYRANVEAQFAESTHEAMTGPLQITIAIYPPDKRRRDIDNVQKAILDSLGHCGVYEGDSQIVKLTIEKFGQRKNGLVEVFVEPIVQEVL